MKVLVGFEFSGVVREAFHRRGHDAWSCDLLPSEIPGKHIQADVFTILNDSWDLALLFFILPWNNLGTHYCPVLSPWRFERPTASLYDVLVLLEIF